MGVLGPSGLAGQGLESQAGTRAGWESSERTGGWHEGSRPRALHGPVQEDRVGGAHLPGQDNSLAALAFRKPAWRLSGQDRRWGKP